TNGAISAPYQYSSITTPDASVPNGSIRLNNSTQVSSTQAYIKDFDLNGEDWADFYDAIDGVSNPTAKAYMQVSKVTDPSKFILFKITDISDGTTIKTFTIAQEAFSSTSPFSNTDKTTLSFSIIGDKGQKGQKGTTGNTGSQGTTGQKGQKGATGSQGTTGAKGTTGQKGAAGAKGATGSQGTTGQKGATGSQGTTGTKGQKGEVGAQGGGGSQGTTGAKGAAGAKGSQGGGGSQGTTGQKGATGSNAGITSFTNGSNNRVITATSSTGLNAESNLTWDGAKLVLSQAALHVGNFSTLQPTTDGLGVFENDVIAYATSDKRLKENITNIPSALDKLEQINGVTYNWKELSKEEEQKIHGNKGQDIGVIAQEIEKILPELVSTRSNGYKAVKYDKIVALLIEAIKELHAKVKVLESK
ncbi:tail fiber domain-containing protein, partial [bacterium]|nr:tail fiber domain-containing protein [bacterium]